ncbi:MAG: hypothetical protein IKF36_00805 [Bacilli bacterium]|nr:hypothetical protein [Bacilli bacterium]
MNDRDMIIILFDYYGELLSEGQKNYFIDYYFNNLSLAEIAENFNVSRNAVSKELKLSVDKLNNYEEKLKLYSRDRRLRRLVDQIEDGKLKEKIDKILDE